MQRGPVVHVPGVHTGTGGQEALHQVKIHLQHRGMENRVPFRIRGLQVDPFHPISTGIACTGADACQHKCETEQ